MFELCILQGPLLTADKEKSYLVNKTDLRCKYATYGQHGGKEDVKENEVG